MIQVEKDLEEKERSEFLEYYAVAFGEATQIVASRAGSRDTGIPIWKKFPFGGQSFLTLIYSKACRLVSILHTNAGENHPSVDSELLDIMNYCAFWFAYRRLSGRDFKKEVH